MLMNLYFIMVGFEIGNDFTSDIVEYEWLFTRVACWKVLKNKRYETLKSK